MPGVRKGIVFDLPRKRLAWSLHRELADVLRGEGYGDALIMPRTWKSALAPALARIPVRTGFLGEMRVGLVNDLRPGEKALPRMVDRCAALALPKGAAVPADWPLPQLVVPAEEVRRWRERMGLTDTGPVAVVAPGAVGPSKRWGGYPELVRDLGARGYSVWVIGGPMEKELAAEIGAAAPSRCRDLTGTDLRNAILATAAADVVVSNDFWGCSTSPPPSGRRRLGFRPDQPLALGPAQSDRRGDRAEDRGSVPALPQADLPLRPPSLHARHPGGASVGGGGGGASGHLNCFGQNETLRQAMLKPTDTIAATHFRRSLEALERAAGDVEFMGQVLAIAAACERALRDGGKLLLAGNGGSAADAQHIAGEFLSRLRFDRNPLPAIALTTDSSVLTAIGNDYGYDKVFERQVRGLGGGVGQPLIQWRQ